MVFNYFVLFVLCLISIIVSHSMAEKSVYAFQGSNTVTHLSADGTPDIWNWLHDCYSYNGDTNQACDSYFGGGYFHYNDDPAIKNHVSFVELFKDFKYFAHQWNSIGPEYTLLWYVSMVGNGFSGGAQYECNPAFESQHMTCSMHSYDHGSSKDLFDQKCNICIPSKTTGTCPVGHYSNTPVPATDPVSGSGTPYGKISCISCERGSWLTCKSGTSVGSNICSYPVQRKIWTGTYVDYSWYVREYIDRTAPLDPVPAPYTALNKHLSYDLHWETEQIGSWASNIQITKSDINALPLQGTLIGQCYACKLAVGISHYGVAASTDSNRFANNKLDFYCPGGSAAPVSCGTNRVAVMDERGWATDCQCDDGYYSDTRGGSCTECPAGFYCKIDQKVSPYWTRKLPCPTYHYSLTGQSTCTKCNTDSSSCCPSGVKDCGRVRTACLVGFQEKDSYCVDCTSCRELSPDPGNPPCYGIYNANFSSV